MTSDYTHHACLAKSVWHKSCELPKGQQALLYDSGSLTQYLRRLTQGKIELKVCREEWQHPYASECERLQLPRDEVAWLRESNWVFENEVWIQNRVIVPAKVLQTAAGEAIKNCGKKSLGDILFSDAQLERDSFDFVNLSQDNKKIIARRSIFVFQQQPMLVTEIFLSPVFEFQCLVSA